MSVGRGIGAGEEGDHRDEMVDGTTNSVDESE